MAIQQDSTTDLERGLRELADLLEQSDIEGARAVLGELRQAWPHDAEVERFQTLLARPEAVVRPGENLRSLDREYAWLAEHGREHPGCWLAVVGDRLVAADPDYSSVVAKARDSAGLENVVVYFQP